MSDPNPPPGFEPLFRTSPFLETVGPLFYRRDPERGLIIGLRIAGKHANARGIAHGGLLVTLADIALGYRTAFGQDPPASLITANLTADFAGAAKIGDWVEAHVDVQKLGSRLAFANAFLVVDGERIVRASAVFTRAGPLVDASKTCPMPLALPDPLSASRPSLSGIGPKLAKLFARLLDRDPPRVIDVLFHLPSGTIDRRARPKLRDVEPD